MPTTIRISAVQPRSAFLPEPPTASIFLIIGLILVVVAVLSGGQSASFGEQSLWG